MPARAGTIAATLTGVLFGFLLVFAIDFFYHVLDKRPRRFENQGMLLGHAKHPETFQPLLQHPVWSKALTWIQHNASALPDGEHEIEGRYIYANLYTVQTVPRSEGIYEAHRKHIDLHYCLKGGELIEWFPVGELTPKTEFDEEKDYGLYKSPWHASSLVMTPGTFAIFLPEDAHMPKVSDGKNKVVRKVVVKMLLARLR